MKFWWVLVAIEAMLGSLTLVVVMLGEPSAVQLAAWAATHAAFCVSGYVFVRALEAINAPKLPVAPATAKPLFPQ